MRHLLTEVKSIKHQMEENQRNLQPFFDIKSRRFALFCITTLPTEWLSMRLYDCNNAVNRW